MLMYCCGIHDLLHAALETLEQFREEWRQSHTGSRRDGCDDWFIAMYADDFFFVGPPEMAAAIYPFVAHTWC